MGERAPIAHGTPRCIGCGEPRLPGLAIIWGIGSTDEPRCSICVQLHARTLRQADPSPVCEHFGLLPTREEGDDTDEEDACMVPRCVRERLGLPPGRKGPIPRVRDAAA